MKDRKVKIVWGGLPTGKKDTVEMYRRLTGARWRKDALGWE